MAEHDLEAELAHREDLSDRVIITIDPDDAKVAIPLSPDRRRQEHVDSTTEVRSIARRSEDESPRWIALLNRMTDELVGALEPSLGDALDAYNCH